LFTPDLVSVVLQSFAQNSSMGIWICNAEGGIEWCNNYSETSSVQSPQDLVGQSFWKYLTDCSVSKAPLESVLEAFRTGKPLVLELLLSNKWQQNHWVELDIRPVETGVHRHIVVLERNISESVKERENLKEIAQRYRHFFEHSFLGITILDEEMIIRECNSREAAILGYDRKQMIGKCMLDFVMPSYRNHKLNMHQKLMKGEIGDFYITEERIHRDGHPVWVSVSSTKLTFSDSEKALRVNFTRDIQEEVKQRKEYDVLRQNMDRFIEALPLPVFIKNNEHKWVNVNSAFCALVGLERAQVIGKSDFDFFPAEQASIFHEKDREVFKQEIVSINREMLTNARGQVRSLLTYKHPYNTMDGSRHLIGIISDITELLEKDALLYESKMQLEAMLDSTMHAFVFLDRSQSIIAFNKKADEESRRAFSVPLQKEMLFPPETASEELRIGFKQLFDKALAGEPVTITMESNLSGYEQQFYDLQFLPVYSSDRSILGVTYSSINATERIDSERQLRESEALLKSINYNIQEGIYRSVYEGRLLYVNKAFADMFGYGSVEEVLALPSISLYVDPDRRQQLAELLLEKGTFKNEEVLFKRKDGITFWALLSSNLSTDDDGRKVFNGAIRDMTEIKKVQHELVAAKESAEELNRLKSNFLANMSHEIRTPINGILGLADIIDETVSDPELKYLVQLQKDSGRRLLDTISSILNLSKLEAEGARLQLLPIDLNTLLEDQLQPHVRVAGKKNIELRIQLASMPLFVMADEAILHQILNNLLGNAIKFTEEGTISVQTSEVTSRKGEPLAEWVVADTGVGISEEFLPHIFSPFEQESSGHKRRFEGNGLGLSITKKYIELLGGAIFVESQKQRGSTFKIHLPLLKGKEGTV
jgi:PAS domain S-box-containing protein